MPGTCKRTGRVGNKVDVVKSQKYLGMAGINSLCFDCIIPFVRIEVDEVMSYG